MYKVIIVDDEEIIVEGLKRVIDWARYDCAVVGTGYDAQSGMQAIREHDPDILFTDINMPGIDGLCMVAGIKSEHPNLQIAVLTGFRDFDYAKRALNLGVTRFMLKPSKMAELEEALEAMKANLEQHKKAPIHVEHEPAHKTPQTAPQPTQKPAQKSAQKSAHEDPESGQASANTFITRTALDYLRKHYAEHITLSELADKVYVSQWYLSKLLNRYEKTSFSDLLNQIRIDHAKQLLNDPSLKVYEIAEKVGFTDVTHFSKVFKKLEGQSPNEYRNSQSNTPQ